MRHTYLYEVLGFDIMDLMEAGPPSDEAIKAAFKKMAKQVHPDRPGGSEKKMAEVNRAWGVLRNKESRARYDETGEGDPIRREESLKGMELMTQLLNAVVVEQTATLFGGGGFSSYKTFEDEDLLKAIRAKAAEAKSAVLTQKVEHETKLKSLEKLLSRLKHKPKTNEEEVDISRVGHKQGSRFDLVGGILRNKGETHKRAIQDCSNKLEELEIVQDMLEHYEFDYTPPPAPESTYSGLNDVRTDYYDPEDMESLHNLVGRTFTGRFSSGGKVNQNPIERVVVDKAKNYKYSVEDPKGKCNHEWLDVTSYDDAEKSFRCRRCNSYGKVLESSRREFRPPHPY